MGLKAGVPEELAEVLTILTSFSHASTTLSIRGNESLASWGAKRSEQREATANYRDFADTMQMKLMLNRARVGTELPGK